MSRLFITREAEHPPESWPRTVSLASMSARDVGPSGRRKECHEQARNRPSGRSSELGNRLISATGHGRTGCRTPTTRWDVAAFTGAVGPDPSGRDRRRSDPAGVSGRVEEIRPHYTRRLGEARMARIKCSGSEAQTAAKGGESGVIAAKSSSSG